MRISIILSLAILVTGCSAGYRSGATQVPAGNGIVPVPVPTATPRTESSPTPTPRPTAGPSATPTPLNLDFTKQTYAGYQGWFTTQPLSSPNIWTHWGPHDLPAPGKITFELYPDVREYPAGALSTTGLGNLGNGEPSKLYASDIAATVDLHFDWMKQYGIEGVALQRFISEIASDSRFRDLRNRVLGHVRSAAERTGRGFYIAYDISGANAATFVQDIKNDWAATMEASFQITKSSFYAKKGGKPVVLIWGFGFPDRPGSVAQSQELVDWFKARGIYVVAGVPWDWQKISWSKPGFTSVYHSVNMIQPWAVGDYSTDALMKNVYEGRYVTERNECNARGIDFQVVIYPGFAWSNWNGGVKNQVPRRGGQHLWHQAYYAKKLGTSAMIAMFDEYDEGTAIAKAAENSSMIPSSQYFLTLDADGFNMSSDFYLRLSGEVTKLLRGVGVLQWTVPIPLR